jgi:hypothetical protein
MGSRASLPLWCFFSPPFNQRINLVMTLSTVFILGRVTVKIAAATFKKASGILIEYTGFGSSYDNSPYSTQIRTEFGSQMGLGNVIPLF